MRAGWQIAGIVGLVVVLSGCGGSGSSGASGDQACVGVGCGSEQAPAAPLVCGGADALECPQGYRCIDDPAAACAMGEGDGSCSGLCVLGEELPRCASRDGEPCPPGTVCVDNPNDACTGGPSTDCPSSCQPEAVGECAADADCPQLLVPCPICADGSLSCPQARCDGGKCVVDSKPCSEAPPCGGISGLSCAPGLRCADDPTDTCVPDNGTADCRGICVPGLEPGACNEAAGMVCAPGFVCVDDPADECVPKDGDPNCGGICVPGEGPLRCGGIGGATCPPGDECVDDPSDSCDPTNGGADCGGLCKPGGGECKSDAECPPLRAPCSVCPDGSEACPSSVCDNGRCIAVVPACTTPVLCVDANGNECAPGEKCVDDPTDGCDPAVAGTTCPGMCVGGHEPLPCAGPEEAPCPPGYICVTDPAVGCFPNAEGTDCGGVCRPAPPPPPQCTTNEECATILAPCTPCPDGTYACPRAECQNGACMVTIDACKGPGFCGGIAGFPCPPGTTCIDDPSDECDPQQGGADCAGLCVREEQPRSCGGITGETCPVGYECADAPNDDCDPANGADCPGICRPVPGDECRSDSECPVIGAPCMLCADGTAACPRSFCDSGKCAAEFPTCDGNQPPAPGNR